MERVWWIIGLPKNGGPEKMNSRARNVISRAEKFILVAAGTESRLEPWGIGSIT